MDKKTYKNSIKKQIRERELKICCRICGEDDPLVIEQHHIEGRANSDVTIPLCKNCHTKITHEQNALKPEYRFRKAPPKNKGGFSMVSIGALLKETGNILIKNAHEGLDD
ncbi:HNH endonuclease signature motif containing protein [Methanococcoides methylutens]|uniref:HNH endonuclease signature motif containing protein n=1 Tax=Methanococcoides methylutens TaxID=2226 RepID=UPI0040441F92